MPSLRMSNGRIRNGRPSNGSRAIRKTNRLVGTVKGDLRSVNACSDRQQSIPDTNEVQKSDPITKTLELEATSC